MPWKSSSSSAAAKPKPMAKSKPGAKSIRGQISAPIPVAGSYGDFAEAAQPRRPHQEKQQLDSNRVPRYTQGFDQNQTIKTAVDSIVLPKVRSGPQRVTIDKSARHNPSPEAGKRLSQSSTKDGPVRKRSPIRNALGRLFGRRKKTPSQLTTASEPAQRSSAPPQQVGKNEHYDPPRGSGASRSASMPVTEYDRALRSHSVGLDDVIAIHSARNSVAVDQTHTKKRSGGSTSPYPLGARYIGDGKLAGLCPRPASANDRDLHSSAIISNDPDEIGRAITSDVGGLKRRSRSMSAMSFFEANQEEHRRRSQEMRELRESCYYGEDALSPLSSEFPEDDALATFNLDLPNLARPAAPEPTAPEPFMFGNLISEEEAANRQQVEEVTLNSRVNGIENRLHVVEDSVSLLRYKANPYANMGWKPSDAALPSGLALQTSFSYPSTRHPHHSLSMGMATTPTPSTGLSESVLAESPSPSGGHYSIAQKSSPPGIARPTSEDTLRGSSLSQEQYSAILRLLETERDARIALETQVRQLTRQLNILIKLSAPVSVFEYDADESESLTSSPAARNHAWRHSQQRGYSLDDSGIDPGVSQHKTGREFDDDDDDESASQLYATPNEETHAAAFSVCPNPEQQEESGSSSRTMSLSRMTMGPIATAVM